MGKALCRTLCTLSIGTAFLFVQPRDSLAQSEPSMYSRIVPSLALIIAKDGKKTGFGTAFCIGSHDGTSYLLTNHHVVGSDPSPSVIMQSDPSSMLQGRVTRISTLDAAVIAVDSAACPPLTLSSTNPMVGAKVAIAGFPFFQLALSKGDFRNLSPSFHDGSVSGLAESGELIEYDAQTDRGNSGSPLFDLQTGVVYGLATLVSTGTTGALQNNLAISVGGLSSFLNNAHAGVSFGDPSAGASTTAASPPKTLLATAIDTRCGRGVSAQLASYVIKAEGELNANDNAGATSDAQRDVELADACLFSIPLCQADQCDDSSRVMVATTELAAQQVLRMATARARGDSVNALRNESTTVIGICGSPNLMAASAPYSGVRPLLLSSIGLIQKVYRARQFRGVFDVDALRTCASKLGVAF